MMLYVENPKDTTRKYLEFINEFDKVLGHKINMQKCVTFLYPNNEVSEKCSLGNSDEQPSLRTTDT